MKADAMKSKTSVALLWILVFILGGTTGAVSHYIYRNHVVAAGPRIGNGNPPRDIVEGLAHDLNLDAQQKQTLRNIIGQSAERYRALAQQFRPQYESIRSETDRQIKQILRGDQKAQFERFLRGLQSRRKQKDSRNNQ